MAQANIVRFATMNDSAGRLFTRFEAADTTIFEAVHSPPECPDTGLPDQQRFVDIDHGFFLTSKPWSTTYIMVEKSIEDETRMGRRSRRVRVHLDASGVDTLSDTELNAVLRGADDLIAQGGRTLLMRILRGSRNKDVLERGLDDSPVFGYFKSLSDEETLARIDWTILNGYLRVEYFHRLPLLVYTDKGWEIERENYTDELLKGIEEQLKDGPPYEMEYLKDRDRGMILLLLDKIESTKDRNFIPALKAWQRVDYKKVRLRIRQAIHALEAASDR